MTTPTEQSRETGQFPLFDWLRFALASVVALGHEGIITWDPSGKLAVFTFFALSGWLIGGILLQSNRSDISKFFYNRGVRIWIPYIFAVATIYIFSALRDPINASYFKFLFYDLTFTHNWFIPKIPLVTQSMPLEGTGAHFWSISVEEQFYLVAPLLMLFVPFGRSKFFWAILALLATISESWYGSVCFGVLAAILREQYGDWQRRRLGFWVLVGSAVASTALIVAQPNFFALVGPVLAISIVLLSSRQGERGAIGRFVGGMSYPLYLYHWIGMFAANFMYNRLEIPLPSIGWTAYLVALVVGGLAYILVDRNVMRFRGRFYRPALGLSLMVIAYSLLIAGIIGGYFVAIGV